MVRITIIKFLMLLGLAGLGDSQTLLLKYRQRTITGNGVCQDTREVRDSIRQDIRAIINQTYTQSYHNMGHVAVVVLDGEELPTSICPTQHRPAALETGNVLLLQKDPVVDQLMPLLGHAILPIFRVPHILKSAVG